MVELHTAAAPGRGAWSRWGAFFFCAKEKENSLSRRSFGRNERRGMRQKAVVLPVDSDVSGDALRHGKTKRVETSQAKRRKSNRHPPSLPKKRVKRSWTAARP